ncbi:glycine cleavage system aminomethyltransferase GcvT [Jiulongibacter sediminis]|jgi:aminomethyltransferase|uniref:glycine cleavage system aminomethyltransferase GcvT n=1 Tax=Jiulongibacter sediminis TaxID=1605367 RepID=UPI0026EB97C5|nr:glycine cleavage system aminomethyltransferase GcvT [Jiulongibacter sediminis]
MTEVREVPLKHVHEALGAKMIPFAGFNMPVRYSSDLEEHMTVREGVGIFDVSHMGEFYLKGEGALDLIQRVSANDASVLYNGKAQYSYLPNETGGVVDDLLVYRIDEDEYMLVVNASNIEKDWNHIQKYNTGKVEMVDWSDDLCLFAVQGSKANATLQKLTHIPLDNVEYYTFTKGTFADVPNVILSATGYTGAGGFELYVPKETAEEVWNKIMEAGAEFEIKPIGLGARDTLRLEMGYCLYGNDITDETSPLEAGLGWVTKFSKEFTNSEALKAEKAAGLQNKLVGIELVDRGIPRSHYVICDSEGQTIGEITSGSMSPSLKKGIALGYVKKEFAKAGTEIYVEVRNKKLKAEVVKTPFVKA